MNLRHVLLILIVYLAFFLRVYRLTDNPPGFFADEAAVGYNAYTILMQGKDEWGVPFPIFFRSFGDYKHPIDIYATVPFVALFGVNEMAVRFPSILFGLVTIISLYFIGKELRSIRCGLLAGWSAAIVPWLIHYDRSGIESSYTALFTLSIAFLLQTFKKPRQMLWFSLMSGLTLYTYQPAKLIAPLLFIIGSAHLVPIYLKNKAVALLALCLFILFIIPVVHSLYRGEGWNRLRDISGMQKKLTAVQIAQRTAFQYTLQLTPYFLFTTGEPTFITRHFTKGLVPLLPAFAPFIYVGIVVSLRRLKQAPYRVLLVLFLLYPIGGSVADGGPYTMRSLIGAPLFMVFAAIGIEQAIVWIRSMFPRLSIVALLVVSGLFVFSFGRFHYFYTVEYPLRAADYWGWQYGIRPIMEEFSRQQDAYDELYMTYRFNAPQILMRYYAITYPCPKCHVTGIPLQVDLTKRQLFALRTSDLVEDAQKNLPMLEFITEKIIYLPGGQPEFHIGRFVSRNGVY